MINSTTQLMVIAPDAEVDALVRLALQRVHDYFIGPEGQVPETLNYRVIDPWTTFSCFINPATNPGEPFDAEWIHDLYRFVGQDAKSATSSYETVANNPYWPRVIRPFAVPRRTLPVQGYRYFKSGAVLTLQHLWAVGAILLPMTTRDFFLFGHRETEKDTFTEVAAFFRRYYTDSPSQLDRTSEILAKELGCSGVRVIWATNWHRIEDVSHQEMADLNQAIYKAQEAGEMPRMYFPFFKILHMLRMHFPDRVRFSDADLDNYRRWRTRSMPKSIRLADFQSERREGRTHGQQRPRYESPEQIDRRNALRRQRRERQREALAQSGYVDPVKQAFLDLAATRNHEAACAYFGKIYGPDARAIDHTDGWLGRPATYPGRENAIDLPVVSARWRKSFEAWLRHRKARKGYETEKEAKTALHLLFDYLFLYLPWWNELNPAHAITIPQSPKDFLRYLFVARDDEDPDPVQAAAEAQLPKTLLEMLAIRRPINDAGVNDAFNVPITQWYRFFAFIMEHYESDPAMAGKGMVNPIRPDWDKASTRRRNKTNKIPVSEDVYPHLVYYGQGIEAFGEYLQQKAWADDWFATRKGGEADGYDTEAYGYVPVVFYQGRCFPIRYIPNLYRVARRFMRANPEGHAGIYVAGRRINRGRDYRRDIYCPHLTVVRLINGLIEVGSRGQGMQWLDRRTWDSLNVHDRCPIESLFANAPPSKFSLFYFNTDKTNDGFPNFVSWRVRRALLAETYFQRSIDDQHCNALVNYEDRAHTRFPDIMPLFRSDRGPKPYADGTYEDCWIKLLSGFQRFYNTEVEPDNPQQFVYWKTEDPRGPVSRVDFNHGWPDFDQLRAIHTPHACRATYATLRDEDLELADIAAQLGQSSEVVASHYQRPSAEAMKRKLEASDDRRMNPVHIRADQPDSAVRTSFAHDRQATIEGFGFIGGLTYWSTDQLRRGSREALDLLRNGPAGRLRWHETHVCPVGDCCPIDIVEKIGGARRCGLCELAAKCVDHLPAIAARQDELNERVRAIFRQIKRLEKAGEPADLVKPLYKEAELVTKELLGWELAEKLLNEKLEQIRAGMGNDTYIVGNPEIVRLQLQKGVKNLKESAFMLKRIDGAAHYPTMETDQLRAQAKTVIRKVVVMHKKMSEEELREMAAREIDDDEAVQICYGLVKSVAAANGLDFNDFASTALLLEARNKGLSSGTINPKAQIGRVAERAADVPEGDVAGKNAQAAGGCDQAGQ